MKFIALALAVAAILFAVSTGDRVINAEETQNAAAGRVSRAFQVEVSSRPSVDIEDNSSPWMNLRAGSPIGSRFTGTDSAIEQFENRSLRAVSLASADVNQDGYPDLISGFATSTGGMITVHRGWKEAFSPESPEVLAGIRNGEFPVPFERESRVFELPAAPDFMFTGRFTEGSSLDLVFASRGGRSLFVMSSDEKGGFREAVERPLRGSITAVTADTIDAGRAYTAIAAALDNGSISIFDGTTPLERGAPIEIEIGGEVTRLVIAGLGGPALTKSIFTVANGKVSILTSDHGSVWGKTDIRIPFRASDIAVGELIRDREGKSELAVLSDNGTLFYLKQGQIDQRPYTTDEVRRHMLDAGRGRPAAGRDDVSVVRQGQEWITAEEHWVGVTETGAQPILQRARITGNETDDLLIADIGGHRLQVLFKEPVRDGEGRLGSLETKAQTANLAGTSAAVLPMRLNVMGQQGLVVLGRDDFEATPIQFVPAAVFTVSKLSDANDGICNADCSVREAIQNANSSPGPDIVSFGVSGTHTLTLAGINEDMSATGDLDIREALTINGNGAGTTIIEAGTNTTNGVDKVMSINPTFASAFATSISGLTLRHGRNQSSWVSGVGFGGAFDWEASTTGSLTMSGVTINANTTQDGDGGGIAVTSFPIAGSTALVSITNSTLSNNDPDRVGSASPIGGGIFVGQAVTFRLTSTVITGNNVNEAFDSGQGGGIYAFGPASSAGKSFLTGSTLTLNTAPSDGGGILSTQAIDFNSSTIISNNSTGRFGGGLWLNHSNASTVINKVTMVGNSATTTGGAIYLGDSITANSLNVSFSRIAGNTGGGFTGVATAGGTATLENNWWGCNTGPNTAGCNGVGVGTVGPGGPFDFDPWLQMRQSAARTTLVVGQSTTLTASFLLNSAGGAVLPSNLDVLINQPITFNNAVLGTVSGAQATVQGTGTATASFTATAAGSNGKADSTVDSGTASTSPLITVTNTAAWDGSASSNWHDPLNWTTDFVPTATNNVDLPAAGVTNQPTISSTDVTAATVTIGANRSLTIGGGRTLTVNGALAMNGLNIDASGGLVQIGGSGTVTRTSGHVLGSMRKVVTSAPFTEAAPAFVFTFPLGTSSGYSPLEANFTAGSGALTAAAINGTAPSTPGLNDATTLDRYWQLTETGSLTASLTFTYLQADIDGTEANYRLLRSTAATPPVFLMNGTPCPGAGSPCVDGTSPTGGTIFAANVQTFDGFWTAGEPLAPTSAGVTVTGRVFALGRGLRNAVVTISDSSGFIASARTNAFGYYTLHGVPSGRVYLAAASAKGFTFEPRTVSVDDSLSGIDFVAAP